MKNEYLEKPLEVGTVLKETWYDSLTGKEKDYYYIVGEYFIYNSDYDNPQIRPHKFSFNEHITIASEEEKKQFFDVLKKEHLIWDEISGKVSREYEKIRLSVELKVKPETDVNELIEKLNSELEKPYKVYSMSFEDF